MLQCCHGLCLDVPPKCHGVIDAAFQRWLDHRYRAGMGDVMPG